MGMTLPSDELVLGIGLLLGMWVCDWMRRRREDKRYAGEGSKGESDTNTDGAARY